eukprot:TRINITY_DN1922_c2_g2_i1.p1 TRINITY_DN1922_c2_g2~~TRINITY_DN1922_c2_g2_i1.p1  ORF type:complete len:221 (-),score=45.83 TRINITY_DN1922_c2_g2_i1:271-933(-)
MSLKQRPALLGARCCNRRCGTGLCVLNGPYDLLRQRAGGGFAQGGQPRAPRACRAATQEAAKHLSEPPMTLRQWQFKTCGAARATASSALPAVSPAACISVACSPPPFSDVPVVAVSSQPKLLLLGITSVCGLQQARPAVPLQLSPQLPPPLLASTPPLPPPVPLPFTHVATCMLSLQTAMRAVIERCCAQCCCCCCRCCCSHDVRTVNLPLFVSVRTPL